MFVINQSGVDTLTPALKWAGSKRWLIPCLRAYWAQYAQRLLVEPFAGGLAVALGLRPVAAHLNDANPHLINFYQWLQRGLMITMEMANEKALYDRHRQRFNTLVREGGTQTAEAAALFYYLNRTGFNGLCRFNGRGEFNVAFGRYRTITYTTDFTRYGDVLQPWHFTSGDFSQVHVPPDAFIYADPPYDVEFTAYSPGGFTWDDQLRFAAWVVQHPGPVIVSNQATPRILKLYTDLGFDIQTLDAPRRIACNGDRRQACEMLATRGIAERSFRSCNRSSAL